jgi:hypothetical protein
VPLSGQCQTAAAWQGTMHFHGRFPEPALWLEMAAVSLVGWVAGAWLFGRLRETVVEAV